MQESYSGSDVARGRWGYLPTGLGRTGRSLSENNFSKERRDWLAILLREILQNAMDARRDDAAAVRVVVRVSELDADARSRLRDLLPSEHVERFRASAPHVSEAATDDITRCLVVEDFGTTGLTGCVDDPDRDGRGENWNAFWFREGEGGKENSAGNGGAGQGKITYFSAGELRTLFAYTVRLDDGKGLLFGASSFMRDYPYPLGGRKWKRDSYWGHWRGTGDKEAVLPASAAEEISLWCGLFGIERRPHETGLSLVIPSPKHFQLDHAIQVSIAEFFVPIKRGHLVLQIGGCTIDKDSVDRLADELLPDARARELHTSMTAGFRAFLRAAIERSRNDDVCTMKRVDATKEFCEEAFDPAVLANLREEFAADRLVSVRVPVRIRRKGPRATESDSALDVHLIQCLDLPQPEQAVIRRDLLIGEEPVGGGRLKQRVRGLTLITDPELSALLLSAEEATHLRWNSRLPRLGEYFQRGPEIVAIVRNAMAGLLNVLTEADKQKDLKLLAKYFSAPGDMSRTAARGQKQKGDKQHAPPVGIPPPQQKLLRLQALVDGCLIRPAREGALADGKLPMDLKVEFAYEGLDRDAFAEYDPLDFDLADKAFDLRGTGCAVVERAGNLLRVRVESEPFALQVRGFDRNLRLRIRVTYKEASDAAAVDAE